MDIELHMPVAVEVFDIASQADGHPSCKQKEKRIYD